MEGFNFIISDTKRQIKKSTVPIANSVDFFPRFLRAQYYDVSCLLDNEESFESLEEKEKVI